MGRRPRVEVEQWFEDALFRRLRPTPFIVRDAQKVWNLRPRQCHEYIRKVRARWSEHHSQNREQIRAELDGSLREIFEKAITRTGVTNEGVEYPSPDLKAATLAARALMDLHGADEPTRVEVMGAIAGAAVDFADPNKARDFVRAFLQSHPELMPAEEAYETAGKTKGEP